MDSANRLRLTKRLRDQLRARNAEIARIREKVAIVGVACRFPGGADPASFWRALEAGTDAVTRGRPKPLPADPETAEGPAWGAYLSGLDRFDAAFFRIAPLEAELMDPQQRLLLEVSWEALEDAGIDPGALAGSRTGVYAGISASDYRELLDFDRHEGAEGLYAATGISFSTAIGRVAFAMGLEGPAIAVDTACSSSLVAIHQAAAGLQRGEADLALAGGVNAIPTTRVTRLFESAGLMAPDGRCKTFDAAADGFVRGEGCGMLVLKRLSDAERDGDRIRGVILGSAVNQDGASAGLTVPNGPAQERVIGEALERAGIAPAAVDYLEAHGTGTELGDPIELKAAAAAYGEGRPPDRPLLAGSVKTNIGHLESAAGVAGVVKVLLAMRKGVIPKHLHFERPNPRLDWDSLPVRVTREATPWPANLDRPARAGVSSFGFSGTNAHLILEAWKQEQKRHQERRSSDRHRPPQADDTPLAERRHRVFPLSGKTPNALRELAARYQEWLAASDRDWETLSDAAWTAGTGRSHFAHRAALVFRDRDELREQLALVEAGSGREAAPAPEEPAPPMPARRPEETDGEFARAVADAYQAGSAVSFAELFPGERRRRIALPTYPFQRERHWASARRRATPGHPLLGERRELPSGEVSFEIGTTDLGWLRDHRVFGRPVAPAAFYAAQALAAVRSESGPPGTVLLEDVRIERPLILPDEAAAGGRTLQLVLAGEEDSARAFEVFSRGAGEDAWVRHATGRARSGVEPASPAAPGPLPAEEIEHHREALSAEAAEALYRELAGAGISYGPAFRALRAAWRGDAEAAGEVELPEAPDGSDGAWHPALLDACLQVAAGLWTSPAADGDDVWLPVAWDRLWLDARPPERLWCRARTASVEAGGVPQTRRVDFAFHTPEGEPAGGLTGLTLKPAPREALLPASAGIEDLLYRVEWRAADLARSPAEVRPEPGVWVVWPEGSESLGADLTRELEGRGQTVVVPGNDAAPARRQWWEAVFAELPEEPPLRGVVHLGAASGGSEVADGVREALSSALALTQGLRDAGAAPEAGVWFVTRGGQVLGGERDGQLAGSALWGFGRTAARELADLPVRMLDLEPGVEAPVGRLVEELLFPDRETEILCRGEGRRVPRLIRLPPVTARPDGNWRFAPDPGGDFGWLPVERVPGTPGEGEVRVAVEAAGLNFHDVLVAMGVVDPDAALGGEFCGRVLEAGSGVRAIAVGDRVLGFAAGTFGPEVVARAEVLVPAPPGLSATALATVPTALVTAALAFEEAELEAGDVVLVHAGTGGVGQAAIQWARAAGLRVYATASVGKREYLRSLGVTGAFDSRSTAFGEEVLAATDGAGVRLVLNSLTGTGFIEAGLSCLAEGGTFVELGKRGIWSAEEMAAARPDVAYRPLAVDRLLEEDPSRLGGVLGEVVERVGRGELTPLPHRRWPLAELGSALTEMREARHVGKLVLAPSPLAGGRLRGDRSYLVTGGLGGVGLRVGEWLLDHGAGGLVLNGRREPEGFVAETVERLSSPGTPVQVVVADVADGAAVDRMLREIGTSGLPPLGGVIHAAGALSDASLPNQDWTRFEQVLGPKALGAWNLHRATLGLDLDLFVLFSSLTGVVGNPGQANHAAANAFLDQLAGWRRARGLPGQAVAWGPWSEVGEAEGQRDRMARGAAAGIRWLTPEQGLAALTRLVREDTGATAVAAVDWERLERDGERLPALVGELARAPDGGAPAADGIAARLLAAGRAERDALLLEFVREEVGSLLRLASSPTPEVGFFELGMDSLTAVELRNRLNRALSGAGGDAPALADTAVFDHPSPAKLAGALAAHFGDVHEERPLPAPSLPPRRADARIAVVGMSCRFPAGQDPASFWRSLEAGADAVTRGRPEPLPVDRETAEHPAWGAYVAGLDRFDAGFFRIAPVEAELMDPQQRLLLEVSWEALEDAGLAPGGLEGSRTGVYAGICGADYRDLLGPGEDGTFDGLYLVTGTSASTAIGRVAFALGLQGPAIAVDTSCSSSLTAIHQAAAALQRGEADLALAGGVNAILTTRVTRLFESGGMLAPDGRCKTFDAAADGYVRGEGCGMLVLKRLSDAERDGDPIQGVILGSAVNQDGASAGLTVPNGPAQERVIREALERAGLAAGDVDYLEAHGTGTELGDPIEVRAAAAVYGEGRPADRPLLLGSVKTNVGHLESAAGVAGVVKVLLAMRHGVIPKHLHFERPNPRLDWERLPVRVVSEATPWPDHTDRPARAAVSSFGVSGTNAHLVLETWEQEQERRSSDRHRPPPADETPLAERHHRVFPLSGKTPNALRDLAARYQEWLTESDRDWEALADAAWTAGTGRTHFAHRAGLAFRDLEDLREQLARVATGAGREAVPAGKVAFLFTGQGSQWAGMGQELYEREPVFREVLDRCAAVFGEEAEGSLLPVLFGDIEGLDRTEWTQPALYALESGLTALWASVGVRPDAVFGHSVGELAAAQAAGAFGLEEGMRFAARRGALMGALPEGGGMAAVFAPEEAVAVELEETNAPVPGAGLSLAAENGTHCVVSGPLPLLQPLARRLEERGVRTERLRTSHAFHSALMEPVLPALGEAAPAPEFGELAMPLVSDVTGEAVRTGKELDGDYWVRQARSPVRFGAALRTLEELGAGVIVEVGPRPVLGLLAAIAWPESAGGTPAVLSSLTGGPGADFERAVGRAYEAGLPVSFAGLFAGERRRRVALPTYPFQRDRYWAKTADADLEWLGGVDDLLYEVRWREAAAAVDPEGAGGPGVWVLAVPEAAPGLARDLSRALGAANQTVVAVSRQDSDGTTGTTARVEPGERESWRSALEALPADAPLRGIVHLGAAGGPGVNTGADEVHRELERALASALALVQGLFDTARAPESGLWLVTRGGQVVGDERTGHPGGSALWGFGRVVARELPDLKVRMLDLDPEAPPPAERLAGELLRADGEPQVAYRGGVRRLARLVRPAARSGPPPGRANGAPAAPLAREDRSYLVTGGLTGLGLASAEWLAGRGARALLLNGRRPPGKPAEEAIRRLRERGVAVRVELGDVAGAETVERLLSRTNGPEAVLPPLGGVIHSAGAFGVASVGNHDRALLESVLRAKVLGAWRLHRATLESDLDLFLLYSSCSGMFGNAGHAAYAAANAFLDQLALHRRALGLAGQAIGWGPWSELGASAAAREALDADVRKTGLGWLTPRHGFAALDRLAQDGAAYGVVAPVDWPAFVAAAPAARPLVEEVAPAAADGEAAESAARQTAARLRGAAAQEREGILLDLVRDETRSVLRLRSLPAPGAGFFDLGMDSVMAVELRNRLNRALSGALVKGGALPNTVVLDFPNPASLAENLAVRLGSGVPAQAARTPGAGVRREYERVRRLSKEDFEAEAEALLDAGEAGP